MDIYLENIGKRYYYWVFRDLSFTFRQQGTYAIKGANGSGKSTLLRIISGYLTPTEGKIRYENSGGKIPISDVYKDLVLVAPYLDLISEFTLEEMIKFHFRFKKYTEGIRAGDIVHFLGFEQFRNHRIKTFSSGMMQRLKLILAFTSDVPVLLLDEPGSFLDHQGKEWMRGKREMFGVGKTIITASNDPMDFFPQDEILQL